ncbi:transmembrane protein UsgS [Xylariaceae sp. FL1019]|nr:transmembrane protein UsgS [Xylariaceae sp. FL1019]
MPEPQSLKLDTGKMKDVFDTSHFDLNAILRGAQLTMVGAHRALQNPAIFTNTHYKQAAMAVGAGIAIRLAIAIPIIGIKVLLAVLSYFVNLDRATWDDTLVNGLDLIANHVLQIPLFLMTLMRYFTPALDDMFMDSLRWVDETYVAKHKGEAPVNLREMYYPNLSKYKQKDGTTHSTSTAENTTMFIWRFARKGLISLAIFALSCVPYFGMLVLPAASFYTFNKAVGLGPAAIIFGTGILLPKRYLIIFLQAYFSSRGLMRNLLEPYFARVHLNKEQKQNWYVHGLIRLVSQANVLYRFRSREGLLFGFGIGFYILLRVPLLGVLIYGIAEASTAYLITKITDPPPPADASTIEREGFLANQQEWRNKHEFVNLSLSDLDAKLRDSPPSYEAAA